MAWTVQIIDEAGTTHNLSNGTITYFDYIDGTGIPPMKRLLEDGANVDGAFDRGFKYGPRHMTLSLFFQDDRTGGAETARDTLASIFAPTFEPLTLKITRDDGSVRQIECFLDGELDFPGSSRKLSGRQDVMVPLVAPDPFWYDPIQQEASGTVASGFVYVFCNQDDMTAPDWPVIEVDGPVTNLSVQHYPLNITISLKNQQNVPLGRTLIIDLRRGYKTIKDDIGANKFPELDTTSATSLNNFGGLMKIHPLKDMKAYEFITSQTQNVFLFQCDSGDTPECRISWYKRYLQI